MSRMYIFFPGLIFQLGKWRQTFVSWRIALNRIYFKNIKRMFEFSFMIHAAAFEYFFPGLIFQLGKWRLTCIALNGIYFKNTKTSKI